MAQDRNKDDATKSNDFSGSSSFSGQGAQAGTLSSGGDRAQSRGQSGQRGQETDFPGQERRPRYGYYYATAVQRISTRRRPSDEQSGGRAQSGPYSSQFIRGTGGQTNPQAGFGGSSYGAGDYGSSKTGLGYDEPLRGFQDRKSIGGERSDPAREGRGTMERGSEVTDRSQGSRVETGSFGGGRSQAPRGEEEQGSGTGRYGSRGFGGEYGRSQGPSGQGYESGRGIGEYAQGYGRGEDAGGYGESRAGVFDPEREQGGGRGEPDWRTQDRERGARGEGRRGHWQREPFTAGEIMTRSVKAVTKQSTLQNVAEIMKDENCGIVPIVDEGHRLLGVVTDRDLVIRTLAEGKSPSEVKVEDVMTDDLEVVTPDEELREVVELMGKKQVRRIPVVDKDDRLVGIIAMADIANRADYDEDLQEALEGISSKRSFWNRLWS